MSHLIKTDTHTHTHVSVCEHSVWRHLGVPSVYTLKLQCEQQGKKKCEKMTCDDLWCVSHVGSVVVSTSGLLSLLFWVLLWYQSTISFFPWCCGRFGVSHSKGSQWVQHISAAHWPSLSGLHSLCCQRLCSVFSTLTPTLAPVRVTVQNSREQGPTNTSAAWGLQTHRTLSLRCDRF